MSADFGSERSSVTVRSNGFYDFAEDYNYTQLNEDYNLEFELSEFSLSNLCNRSYGWCCDLIGKLSGEQIVYEEAPPLVQALVWVAAMENNEVGMTNRNEVFKWVLRKNVGMKTPLSFSQPNVLKQWLEYLNIGHATNINCVETSSREIIANQLEKVESAESNTFLVNCGDPVFAVGKGQFELECFLGEKKGLYDRGIYTFKRSSEILNSLLKSTVAGKLWIIEFQPRSTEGMISRFSSSSEYSHYSIDKSKKLAFDPQRDAMLAYLAIKRKERNSRRIGTISPH